MLGEKIKHLYTLLNGHSRKSLRNILRNNNTFKFSIHILLTGFDVLTSFSRRTSNLQLAYYIQDSFYNVH